jgi:hypothetical protein
MSAAAGPVVRRNPATYGPRGLPPYFDGTVFLYDFMRNWIMEAKLDDGGNLMEINPLFTEHAFIRPIDIELGPDGRLYVLEWGTEFWGQNRNGQLARLDYYGTEPRPPAAAEIAPVPPPAPSRVFEPRSGGFFDYGHPLAYRVDPAASGDVVVQPYLGHDTHTHRLTPAHGTSGLVTVMPDLSHAPYIIDEFLEIDVRFGAGASERIRLHPRRWQAENYTDAREAQLVVTNNRQRPTFFEETEVFIELGNRSHAVYGQVDLSGISSVVLRLVPEAAGRVELRLDAPDGPLLAEAPLTPAPPAPETEPGDPPPGEGAPRFQVVRIDGWTEIPLLIRPPEGIHDVFVVFHGPASGTVAKFDWIAFQTTGTAAVSQAP